MKITSTELPGVAVIEAKAYTDVRGSFARLYCPDALAEAGLAADGRAPFTVAQINLSRNHLRHTLRGMHYQASPHAEAKVVSVTRGAIFDVAVDLRPDSPTHRRWFGIRLDSERSCALFVPEGCAHGFLTLEANTDVLYLMGRAHTPGQGRGFRWNDPAIAVDWPAEPAVISDRDSQYPDLDA